MPSQPEARLTPAELIEALPIPWHPTTVRLVVEFWPAPQPDGTLDIGVLLGNGKPVSRQTVYRALGMTSDSNQFQPIA